ncbi:MAG TPA: isoamylase early set domain-containing protein [Longimicrobiales bacterium]
MDKRLQAYLDGELERNALPAELRAEAERWEQLDEVAAELRREQAPSWLETRVMATLPAHAPRPWWRRASSWLIDPQLVSIRPATLAVAGAAAIAAVLILKEPVRQPQSMVGPSSVRPVSYATPPVIYVQFAFADQSAKSVTIAGDFNDWDAEETPLRDSDGDGVWTGLIALRPGMHKYMFVVNGERWVTDPEAESYVDDGFGMRNAVIAITLPGRAI